jgi:uncharacterized alpha-E superfamily protein
MLSRLAESFFWLGRNVERAGGTARLLVETHQLLVEDSGPQQADGIALLLHGLGFGTGAASSLPELVALVYGNSAVSGSVVGSLDAARANARSVRDALPSDFYEALTKAQHRAAEPLNTLSPGAGLRDVLESLALVHGVFAWVSPRDEARSFYQLGRYLERIDLVARLLNMRLDVGWPEQGPATMLRAVAGLHTFLRRHARMTAEPVRMFLLKDAACPRSLLRTAINAEESLHEIAEFSSTRAELTIRPVALLRAELDYTADLLDDATVDRFVAQAIETVEATTTLLRERYFRPVGSIVWNH